MEKNNWAVVRNREGQREGLQPASKTLLHVVVTLSTSYLINYQSIGRPKPEIMRNGEEVGISARRTVVAEELVA